MRIRERIWTLPLDHNPASTLRLSKASIAQASSPGSSVSYDFAEVGLDGVTAYIDYISGNRAVDSDLVALNDNETDINVDYRIKESMLKNIWLRVRSGFVHEATVDTTKDLRVGPVTATLIRRNPPSCVELEET